MPKETADNAVIGDSHELPPIETGSPPPPIPPVTKATPTWRQAGGPGMYSYTATDTPSSQYYYTGELAQLTGYSLEQTDALERLGILPPSACNHVYGRFWLRSEIDGWIAHLNEPGVREWVRSFLPVMQSNDQSPSGVRNTPTHPIPA